MIPLELMDLCLFSARLGAKPEFVQGPGGNTSLKHGGHLWVKASGTWLAHALERPIFVAVDLLQVKARLDADEDDPVGPAFRPELGADGLRPSIETTLHALLDHPIVVHTHSVATIAVAVRVDAREQLSERLAGLRWAFVPYARPGVPLTRAVRQEVKLVNPDVLVLGNHGLVIGADQPATAQALLDDVEERLKGVARHSPIPADVEKLAAWCAGTDYAPVGNADDRSHAIATDPVSARIAMSGSLYPDHVVFLGPGLTTAQPWRLSEQCELLAASHRILSILECGIVARNDLKAAERAMVHCLADVAQRIPQDVRLNYLTTAQEDELRMWDAEKQRQAMNL